MYWSRLRIFLVLVMLAMLLLSGRLALLQLTRAEVYRQEASDNLRRPTVLLETRRGTVRDRSGLPLAEDVPRFDLCAYYPFLALPDEAFIHRKAAREIRPPDEVRDEMADLWLEPRAVSRLRRAEGYRDADDREFLAEISDLWIELAQRTGMPLEQIDLRREDVLRRVDAIRERIRAAQGRDVLIREETYRSPGSVPHPIVEDLSERAKAAVVGLQRSRPFLVIQDSAVRRYRYGDLAGHVLGYTGEVPEERLGSVPSVDTDRLGWALTPEESRAAHGDEGDMRADVAQRLRSYQLGDTVGRAGIEAVMESVLRGSRGLERRRAGGEVLERIDPRPGKDVILTLDVPLQSEVEAFLARPANLPEGYGTPRGAAVVIDLADGGILALASTPRYNPNTFFADYSDLVTDEANTPLVHRAISGQTSLGSIFKMIGAVAALSENVVTAGTTLHCGGRLDPDRPDRFTCLGIHGDIAVERAIRVSCNTYFYRAAMMLGRQRVVQWGRRFGLGRRTGILLPGEARGHLPDRIDARNLIIGQGQLMVTPLQVARVAALVATGGRIREVHVIKEVRAIDDPSAPPAVLKRPVGTVDLGLRPDVMETVRRALAGVVNGADGTGRRAVRSGLIRIAGKTGSAQSGRGRPTHSWFVGFAPAERPQIAFAVIIEQSGHGSTVAGPVARQIVESALHLGLISAD